jgi:NAD(P)-dependent dehydrogenase (short-subunit alcohol dehydrogenase family)
MQSAINHLPNKIPGNDADVANIINFLISGNADFINGAYINLDGGATLREQFSLIWPKNET